MKSRLDWIPQQDAYALRIYETTPSGFRAVQLAGVSDDGEPTFKDVEGRQGEIIPPFMVIPGPWVGAFHDGEEAVPDLNGVVTMSRHFLQLVRPPQL